MRTDQAIDFAYAYMQAQKALNQLHDGMLAKDYDYAIQSGIDAIADIRIAVAAIRHEKEIKDALRQQT